MQVGRQAVQAAVKERQRQQSAQCVAGSSASMAVSELGRAHALPSGRSPEPRRTPNQQACLPHAICPMLSEDFPSPPIWSRCGGVAGKGVVVGAVVWVVGRCAGRQGVAEKARCVCVWCVGEKKWRERIGRAEELGVPSSFLPQMPSPPYTHTCKMCQA